MTGLWECSECDGMGGAEVPVNPNEPWQVARYWHWVQCPECKGHGKMLCNGCGEEPATILDDGLRLCPDCYTRMLVEEAREALQAHGEGSRLPFPVRP